MFKNVYIQGVGSYHPKKIVDNQYYVKHFKKYNLEEHAIGLMEKVGREKRTLAEKNETSITMAVEACKTALVNGNLKPEDIDAIISVSDTPEYLTPCCALILKNKLQAINVTNVFDINNDCIGMITGIDIASRYLKTDKKYKRILVVGAMNISPFAKENDLVVYGCISDGAAAVILEVREEAEERGVLGSRMYTDDTYNETIRFPACGLSNIADININPDHKKMQWNPFDFGFLSEKWTELITGLLKENGYSSKDVAHYFMSQFSKADLELTIDMLGSAPEQATFVGNKYGYTGCTSPIMALDDKLKEEKFSKDDITIFCSVAGGYTMAALLYKW
ncbi:ketoacyl-ACP synthase III [Clostridium sp. UBA4548]|uniref:ketoacyl-ACP synthase III n=1 Tax=Clostridium sp. UBA4548 TaxID=1946361 RepID=UPI0025C30EAA|nr:ketoacyl-ACP synthase III [Clostridium sp. UBA4548]